MSIKSSSPASTTATALRASRKRPGALRRTASGFADYVVEVLTAVQVGRAQHPVISAFKN